MGYDRGLNKEKRFMQEEKNKFVKQLTQERYKYGFTTDLPTEIIERGLNEEVVRLISRKKE